MSARPVSAKVVVSRRGLLRGAGVAVAGAALVPAGIAAPPIASVAPLAATRAIAPSTVAPPSRVLLQASPVAGFQYHAGDDVWHLLRVGDPLALVREAANPHDERAVRLEWEGEKLGYIPARDNAAISQLLDADQCLDAVIAGLAESADPWERVEVAVYLTVRPSS